MTYNQLINKFKEFCANHKFIKTFGTGEEWEINELKPDDLVLRKGLLYQLFFAIPIDSTDLEQTKNRRFRILCFDIVKKDKSNEQEVLSDTEQSIDDFIRYCRNTDDFLLINDPVAEPFKESYGDWCAGWGCEVIIETDFNSNACDLPLVGLNPVDRNYASIYDQDGNLVTKLRPGQTYNVIIASGIDEGGASQTYTISVIDIN